MGQQDKKDIPLQNSIGCLITEALCVLGKGGRGGVRGEMIRRVSSEEGGGGGELKRESNVMAGWHQKND